MIPIEKVTGEILQQELFFINVFAFPLFALMSSRCSVCHAGRRQASAGKQALGLVDLVVGSGGEAGLLSGRVFRKPNANSWLTG